jgi:biopolymer transport protein ExbB/TolQ
MLDFLRAGGPFGWLIAILALANLVLALRGARLLSGGDRDPRAAAATADTILFWGAVSAVLGLLGQYSGIYNALGAIIRATEIDPRVIAEGFLQSFTTTLEGLTVLVLSAVAWFALRALAGRAAPAGESATGPR